MDKFDFMSIVASNFEGLKSEDEIEIKADQMIKIILQSKEMAKNYLDAGIL